MAPLIPQELWLLEHFTSLEYYGRMRDAWELVVRHNEECLHRFMQNLPPDYRNRPQFEQPDIVWGEKVLPNFRSTLRGLMDGYIKLSHGDYSALSWASGPPGDLRGVRDSWDGWMTPEEQKKHWDLLGEASAIAHPVHNTDSVLWYKGLLTRDLNDPKTTVGSAGVSPPDRWPAYRIVPSITVETDQTISKTGLYLPEQEEGCAAFLIEGEKALVARIKIADARPGQPHSRREPTLWTCVERVAEGEIDPVPSLISEPRMRVEAGNPCPRSGWWMTPAKEGSRRYFQEGEAMPLLSSEYGLTIWQWDVDQSNSPL